MYLLMPYTVTAENRGRKGDIEFPTLEDAISFGRINRIFYDILDTRTSKTLDWTEINETFDDPWYYDEGELIWKKYKEE
ncbi:MAG: hypothetical protein WCI71_05290 [Bacteroidota bacterium]